METLIKLFVFKHLMRGISTVIATILLLVMIVVITTGVFYFLKGTVASVTTTGQEAIGGAISQTEFVSKFRVIRGFRQEDGKLGITLYCDLSGVTIERVDVGNQTNVNAVNCSDASQTINYPISISQGINDICVDYSVSSGDKVNVIIYAKYEGKIYDVQEILIIE